MNNNLIYFDEPKLAFGYDQTSEDPRDGLSLFGPYASCKTCSIFSAPACAQPFFGF